MAKYSNTVEYNIRTTLDSSGIAKLQSELTQLQNKISTMSAKGLIEPGAMQKTLADINKIQSALQQAFNPKLGMFNSSTFMKSVGSMNEIYSTLSKIGPAGTQAFNSIYGQVAKIDTGMRSVSSATDKIMNTLGNTVRWGLIASGFSQIMNAAHQAAQYVQDLDRSLTNIMMVSGETRDNMNAFAKSANEIAQRLGGTTTQMTEATKVFIQQGYSLDTSAQLGEYAVHLANVSEQDSATASDEITAYMNAFKIPLDDLGNAISKWAAVANNTAVDVEELSIASQKAASVAATVGVDLDQFAGHIAAIESVTREAPENIGNGLKSIYSRIADISLGETLEDGVNLGSFAKALEKVGVDVLDQTGKLRDAGIILEDLMGVWQELDNTQRAAVAKTVAGRFQLARFEALMNRADIYEQAANTSRAETGTATYDRMQETYRDSLEGRSKALQASIEEIFLNLFTTDSFYPAIDAVQGFVDTINDLIEATGGGETALLGIVAVMTKLASNSMSRGIANFIQNRQADMGAQKNIENARLMAQAQLRGEGLNIDNARTNKLANNVANMNQYANLMNEEQIRQSNELLQQAVQIENDYAAATEKATQIQNVFRVALSDTEGVGKMTAEQLAVLAQQMAAMTEEEILASQEFNQLRSMIQNVNTSFQQFAAAGKNATQVSLNQQQIAQNLIKSFTGLRGSVEFTEQELQQINSVLRLLEKTAKGDVQAFNQLSQSGLEQLARHLDISDEKLLKLVKDLGMARGDMAAMGAQSEHVAGQMERLGAGLQMQNVSNQVIGLTNSLMSAGFALMSFKGLIDVINNEDLTIAEKFEQFNMNLLMVAAMGIPAITQFKTAITGISEALKAWEAAEITLTAVKEAQTVATQANIQAALKEAVATQNLSKEKLTEILVNYGVKESEAELIAAQIGGASASEMSASKGLKDIAVKGMRTVATKVLAIAIGELAAEERVAALSSGALLGIFAAVAAAIAIVTFAVQAVSKAEEDRKAALQASLDASNSTVNAIKEQKDNLDSLYETYQKTGKATREFKDALLEQAEAAGVSNAKMLIATGQYTILKQKIDEATEAQLRYNNSLLQQQNKDLKLDSSTVINDSETERRMAQAGVNVQTIDSSSEYGYTHSATATDDSYTQLLKYEDTANQLIQKQIEVQKNIAELTKQQQAITGENAEQRKADLQTQIDDLNNQKTQLQNDINWYQSQINSETGQKIMANGQQIVDNNILLAQNDSAFQYTEGQSIDDYKTQIAEELRARGEQVSDEILDKYVEGIAAGSSESAEALATQKGYEDAKQAFTENASNLMLMNSAQGFINPLDTSYYTQNIVNAIDNQDISVGDKTKLFNWIDWEGTQTEIDEQLNAIISNFEAEKPLSVDQFLTEQGAEGFSLKEQAQSLDTENLDDDIKNSADTYRNLAEGIAEAGSEMEGFSDDLKDNIEDSSKAASAILRYDSALERASKSMEEWQSMLNSGAAEDHAAAAAELRDVYSDILDLTDDMDLSLDFAADPENLELLQRVMQGDIDAYDELADRAQADIEIQAGIDTAQAEADVALINSMLDELGYEDIAIGAHIESDQLEQELNNIIQAAGMTAEQAESLLASMGLTAELESAEEEVPTPQTIVSYDTQLVPKTMDTSVPTDDGKGTTKGEIKTASIITTPHITTVPGTAKGAAFGLNVTGTSTGKSSGGGVKIKSGSVRKATSGAAKYANSSHGGGSKSGGSGSGGSCFVAGTLITLYNQYKTIENIKKGDTVLSYNEQLNINEYSKVVQTMIHNVYEKIYSLYIDNEILEVTGIHRFFVKRNNQIQWIAVQDLHIHDQVLYADSTWHEIYKIKSQLRSTIVYNFEVSNNHNYYVGKNQILAHNKGGSGGKTSTKKADPIEKKDAKTDIDPYNKINSQLETMSDRLDKISKAKERAFGNNARKLAGQEIQNLKKQNELLKERNKISEAKKSALLTGKDNPALGIYTNGESLKKYGLTDKDNDGTVDNLYKVYGDAVNKVEAARKAYNDYVNSHGNELTEDQQKRAEELKENYENAKKYADGIESVASDYQDTCDKIRDDTQQILDNMYEMEDIQIELFQNATESVDKLKELKDAESWFKGFYSGKDKDSPFRAMIVDADKLHTMLEGTTDSADAFFKTMIEGSEDAVSKNFWKTMQKEAGDKFGDGTSVLDLDQFYLEKMLSDEGKALYGSNEKQYYEDLQKMYDKIQEDLETIEDEYAELLDDILNGYDDIADRMDRRNEQLQYDLDLLDHERNMIEKLHGDDAYGLFGLVNDAQVAGLLQKTEEIRTQYDYWVEQRDKYNKETQKELWEAMNEKVQEWGNNLTEATEESADAMIQQYNDATDKILKDLSDKLFGGEFKDATLFEKEWEMANDQAEQYLDTVERSMELEKLRNKYQKMLNNTNDLTTQNKIKAAMDDQLKALENQKKAIINNEGELEYVNALSQFDVDLANAKIEALQKQIALEEAQRNKNQMQLRRDTQGNYRYVYRADEEDLASAQEDLADADYEIYEMSKARYGDILNERWNLYQEYQEKMRNAKEQYADDDKKLTQELEEIAKWYTERQVNLGLELADAQEGMIEGVQHLAEDTTDYVSQTFADIGASMQDNWAQTMGEIGVLYSDELANLTADTAGFMTDVKTAQDDTIKQAKTYISNVEKLEKTAKTDFTNVGKYVQNVTSDMDKLNKEAQKFMDIINADTGGIDDATQLLEQYRQEIENTKKSASALGNALVTAQRDLDAKTREAQNYKTQIEDVAAGKGYFDKNGNYVKNPEKKKSSSSSNGSSSGWNPKDDAYKIWVYGAWGSGGYWYGNYKAEKGKEKADAVLDLFNSGYGYSWMNTGGYTGTWNSNEGIPDAKNGKMAVLHQKELVLNATDTENMLAAVDIVRTIVDSLKNLGSLDRLVSLNGLQSTQENNIEQRVEITAEFPNVDTADDIREALLSLSDNAFQYAYKIR